MDGTGAITQGEDQGLKLLGQVLNLGGDVAKALATPGPVKVGPSQGPPPNNEKQTAEKPQAEIPIWVWGLGGVALVGIIVLAVK